MFATAPAVGKRDLRIDSLRGLLLVFMAIDHIASDLKIATNHIFGYVSAAEGFVFISGLVGGLVYARRRWASGPQVVQEACWRRAGVIYAFHIALYYLVWNWTLAGYLFHGKSSLGAMDSDATSLPTLAAGILLLNQPPLLDILPMYCGLMLLLPVLLAAFDRGWRGWVLLASFGAWTISNTWLPPSPWNIGVVHTSAFSFLAWQLLFVTGAAFGHAWAAGGRLVPRPTTSWLSLSLLICGIGYIVRHAFIPPPVPRTTLDWLTDKNNLAPWRLLNTAALFYLFYAVADRFPRLVQWRPLAFLGRNSLAVFSMHVAVAYVVGSLPEYFAETEAQRWLGTGIMVGAIFLAAYVSSRVRRPARALVPQPA